MRSKTLLAASRAILTVILTTGVLGATSKTIHNFGLTNIDGQDPQAGLIFDNTGNLYGTTYSGGSHGQGAVFEMISNGSGGWTTRILHNFGAGSNDGTVPQSDLVFDSNGNIYGTTNAGGTHDVGVVFEMTPNGQGGWTEKVLHNFGNAEDGTRPQAGLIIDSNGNLYGTTFGGGTRGDGTAFEVTPNGSGGWTERVLHNFGTGAHDGVNPSADLIFDAAGNLYGTTVSGGNLNSGTVFELIPNGSGGWTETVLHNFGHAQDGDSPQGGALVFDTMGNLYGTTNTGGTNNAGTVFEMSPNGSGGWTERTLHNFGFGFDGNGPYCGVVFDSNGNLYGTTVEGGNNSVGVVFKMTPNGDGTWTETKLHNFGTGNDGAFPQAGVIVDSAGHLYGTAGAGGTQGDGTVFQVTP